MEKPEMPRGNFDDGFNTLICQEELHNGDHISYPYSNLGNQQDNRLTDTHLASDKTQQVRDNNKTAIEILKKQLKTELNRQKKTKWELDHQTRSKANNLAQIDKIKKDIASMKSHLPMIRNGCRHCPPGWILMNSMCYYFSFLESAGLKTWQKAREYCKLHKGDLAIINNQDKVNATVSVLINKQDPSKVSSGFWIGLSDMKEEGAWKWVDETILTEGYWKDGEPNDTNNEDCAAVYPVENFFQAWNDARCENAKKWICEKAPLLN
ncbi:CD209 antigen-like protein E isoform X2 [Mastacembelus armatus]|uniref:CD209 antigen-like protein E isoform X2 n=1 Tax=Mastacembelus armatus TaxID=205130 RepID=UPI000E4627CC|nr:CD209 antigen-like protein E isoform X2 [Mastacembelus armatus]